MVRPGRIRSGGVQVEEGRCYPPFTVNRFFRSALFPLVVIVLLVYLIGRQFVKLVFALTCNVQ